MTAAELARRRGSPSATRGSGSSSRRWPAWSRSTTSARPADERRFTLPNAHAHVLLDDDSEACMKPLRRGRAVAGQGHRHHGRGVPGRHGRRVRRVRPARHPGRVHPSRVRQPPHADWLPALPEVQAQARRPATPVRIAEVGCGEGLAAITIAKAYPNAAIDGFDLDDASIAVAARRRRGAGVGRSRAVRGARRRRPGDRRRLRPRDGHRDAPRRARPGRDPAHDAPPRRRRGAVARRRRADRGRLHRPGQRDGAVLLRLQHAALPGGQHAGRRGGHRHGDPPRHACAATRPRPASPTVEVLDVDHPQFVLYRLS